MAVLFSGKGLAMNADAAREIDYLLSYISSSGCVFIRNGEEHNAQDARNHIERKYNYLKSRIETPDEFIEYAASKSSFSGKLYRVQCGDKQMTSSQWLQDALRENHQDK
jgi:hypothetical protein